MSFSKEIKEELSQLNNLTNKEEVKYELLGYLISNNTIKLKNKIKYSTENEYNINRFAKLLKNIDLNDFSIDIQGKIFCIEFKIKNLETIKIDNFNISNYGQNEVINFISQIENLSNIKALVRGIFMGSGSINNPNNSYHLELELSNLDLAKVLTDILSKNSLSLKTIDNKIYIKDGEEISKFLAFIGCNKSVITFEEIRVQRYMNNKVNRLVNCETANLNKILNASVKQINAIKRLKETGKFQSLDSSLKEIAELRLEHPDMPTSELGNLLSKPLGKSGVNYRLKKIVELAE